MTLFRCTFICCLFLFSFSLRAQVSFCQEAEAVVKSLEAYHFSPPDFSAAQAHFWLTQNLDQMDPAAYYWTQADLEALKALAADADLSLSGQACRWFEGLVKRYTARLGRIQTWVDSLPVPVEPLAGDLLFGGGEEGPARVADMDALQARWQARLLARCYQQWMLQAADSLRFSEPAFLAVRDSLWDLNRKSLSCELSQKLHPTGGLRNHLAEVALHALAQVFDPHTMYFSAGEVAEFEAALAKEALSYGLEVSKNDQGQFEIDHLQPGGPAWNSHQLNQGDLVLEIKGAGDLDLQCASEGEVAALLQAAQQTELRFRVRKVSGELVEVKLKPAKLTVEENVITGFVLQGERRMGYIYLPGFYTDEESESVAMGLANDVAKEMLKLQLAGIEGLILDLRSNGGGAIMEAIGLAGIFIDEGPVGVIAARDEPDETLKDFYRGTGYDGPLLVLVDETSASASEMFAAAIQDYGRGVIAGSPTYGKATGQIVVSVAEAGDAPGAKGFLKLTMCQFSRVDGQSHQGSGVQPDILLPSLWESVIPQEAEMPHALQARTVDPARGFAGAANLPLADLAARSRQRVQASPQFQQVQQWAEQMPRLMAAMERPSLTFAGFAATYQEADRARLALEALQTGYEPHFQVKNQPMTESLIQMDPIRKAQNKDQMERIRQDPYIEEGYFILQDLIEQP